jgi:hypothetical protein
MDPDGHSPDCDFISAVEVLFEEFVEEHPKATAMINKIAAIFNNLLILHLLSWWSRKSSEKRSFYEPV